MTDQLKLNSLGEMNLYLHAREQELKQRLLDDGDLTTLARMCEIKELIKMTNLEISDQHNLQGANYES